jgi:geranylgeranyl diphosphate synthase type II
MDNSDTRRGKSTTHKLYGEDIALLAGDALLTEAFHILASEEARSFFSPEIQCSLIFELSRLSGIGGMVEGQAFEISYEPKTINQETLTYIIDHKTAALFDASLRMGAIVAGLNKEGQDSLGFIGRLFGQAFQLADDLADFSSDPDGINYVNLVGAEPTKSLIDSTMEKCLEQLTLLPFSTILLQDILRFFWKTSFSPK